MGSSAGVAPKPFVPFNSWTRTPPRPVRQRTAALKPSELEAWLAADHERTLRNGPALLAASLRRAAARAR